MNDQTSAAYLDCFSGVSGDMLLGALIHAGFSEELLREELGRLNIPDLTMEILSASSQGIACRRVLFSGGNGQPLRTLPVILPILENSGLAPEIVQRAMEVFQVLAEAEARVHGVAVERVHFHEIGALDTIADIVGVVAGLHHLGVERITCSPLPLGRGFVQCDHGRLPLPAPAVCELLAGVPTYGVEIPLELVTPTGAALIKVLADSFGPMPAMIVSSCGYGGGSRTLPNHQPNLLRIVLGKDETVAEAQRVTVTETRLDDWNPEGFPHLCARLMAQGALDVSLAPCHGKKGRPGYSLQVLSTPAMAPMLQDLIFNETTAIGLRMRHEDRRTLPRRPIELMTRWGPVTAKQVERPAGSIIYPEYEACRRIAEQHDVPLDTVYREIYSRGEK